MSKVTRGSGSELRCVGAETRVTRVRSLKVMGMLEVIGAARRVCQGGVGCRRVGCRT